MSMPVLVCSLISVFMLVLGYLIWVKKKLFLIAGYKEESFKGNKERLAKTMGAIIYGSLLNNKE